LGGAGHKIVRYLPLRERRICVNSLWPHILPLTAGAGITASGSNIAKNPPMG
jgi:hypothetical protein